MSWPPWLLLASPGPQSDKPPQCPTGPVPPDGHRRNVTLHLKHVHRRFGTEMAGGAARRHPVGCPDVEQAAGVLVLIDVGQSSGVRLVRLQRADPAPVMLVEYSLRKVLVFVKTTRKPPHAMKQLMERTENCSGCFVMFFVLIHL